MRKVLQISVLICVLCMIIGGCSGNKDSTSANTSIKILQNQINYLMADKAERSESIEMLISKERGKENLKRFWAEKWTSPEQYIKWQLNAPKKGKYNLELIVSAPPKTQIEIQGPSGNFLCETDQAADRWNWHWDRITVPEPLELPKGISTITVKLAKPLEVTNEREACLKSLELIHVDFTSALEKQVESFKASTKWLQDAKFGVMFQWGEWGYPRHGDKKQWPEMINDFDVEEFAEKMASIQAGYVIWSATWRTYFFPAPIKAIDKIMPGRTSQRDLIGELADALARHNIKLMLYYHLGHETTPQNGDWWSHNWISWDDKNQFYDNWCSIISEVGERYGDKLAGWLFDDDSIYYPAPYDRLGAAAKAGSPRRLVSYNSWRMARGTDLQELFFGEHFQYRDDLPVGGSGIFSDGPYKGLQAHSMFIVEKGSGWGIWKPDTKITGLRYTEDEAIKMALHAAERNYILSWNLLMYEDGSIEEETLNLMKAVGKAVRAQYK